LARDMAAVNLNATTRLCASAACRQLGSAMRSAMSPNFSNIDPCTDIWDCRWIVPRESSAETRQMRAVAGLPRMSCHQDKSILLPPMLCVERYWRICRISSKASTQ
jgi:hypothetical protein